MPGKNAGIQDSVLLNFLRLNIFCLAQVVRGAWLEQEAKQPQDGQSNEFGLSHLTIYFRWLDLTCTITKKVLKFSSPYISNTFPPHLPEISVSSSSKIAALMPDTSWFTLHLSELNLFFLGQRVVSQNGGTRTRSAIFLIRYDQETQALEASCRPLSQNTQNSGSHNTEKTGHTNHKTKPSQTKTNTTSQDEFLQTKPMQ